MMDIMFSQRAHCALVFVVELANHYRKHGLNIDFIAREHHIPLHVVAATADQLQRASLIQCSHDENGTTLYKLSRSPYSISVEDVVKHFYEQPFEGVFINETTGTPYPQSNLSKIINRERQYINNYIQHRHSSMSILHWSDGTSRRNLM